MKKYLLPLLSVMLLMGLSTTGMAAPTTDASGDQFVAGKDLLSVDALFYPPSSITLTRPYADWVKLSVKMAAGSTLPGMITWDFNADNNLTTGGGSSLNMPFSPCPEARCKVEKGFDFFIMLILRDQSDTGNNAYCTACEGPLTNCATRGPEVPGCTTTPCYELGDICQGGAGCYSVTDPCAGSIACGNSYPLDQPCTTNVVPCGTGLKWGEWYAGVGPTGNRTPILRGRIDDLTSIVNEKTEYCFTLPYGDIIAYLAIAGILDITDAVANPPYQVSIWHDATFADGEDFFDPLFLINVADYVPNVGYAASSAGAEICSANTNPEKDCKVDLTDLVNLKAQFNRANCPNCECTKP